VLKTKKNTVSFQGWPDLCLYCIHKADLTVVMYFCHLIFIHIKFMPTMDGLFFNLIFEIFTDICIQNYTLSKKDSHFA
jgi:hypothetical protein